MSDNLWVIEVPELHPAQIQVKEQCSRFNVFDMGRRWGKTIFGMDLAIETSVEQGLPFAWFAPTYKYLAEVWETCVRNLRPAIRRSNAQERRIELATGGIIDMWTLENIDAGRGRKYARAVVDEAAMVPGLVDFFNYSLRACLMDYVGDAYVFSTPKGRNGFYRLYQMGLDQVANPEWRSFRMPTSSNPYIPASEIEDVRRRLPERVFAQEYLAEFLDDAGGVFRKVVPAATASEQPAIPGHQYVMGVDWGKHEDFTALTVLDITAMRQAALDRFNQIDYVVQSGRLKALAERYQPTVIMAESNSMGEPIIERLQREGLPVRGFTTTNATKAQIIEGLALAFERGDLAILNDPVLVGELQAYEMTRLPSGMVRYSAPEGMHDDTVMSLALAYSAAAVPSGAALVESW